jgi:predicted nucleotidyltransferase
MYTQDEILLKVKSVILEEIPDAKVFLFGSRATGNIHNESDWDILVLTSLQVDRALKKKMHYKIFPLSLKIFDFIDCTIVNEKDWIENPSYYVLHHSIKNEAVLI